MLTTACGRYCCKSLFALLIKNSPGCRRDVRVKMWGTSSPDDKLVSDLAKAAEATKIGARRFDRLKAGKLSLRNCGLLQQYLPIPDLSRCSKLSKLYRRRVQIDSVCIPYYYLVLATGATHSYSATTNGPTWRLASSALKTLLASDGASSSPSSARSLRRTRPSVSAS